MSDAEYLKCLKLERDRERSHRKSRQGRFESSMVSLDQMPGETVESSPAWMSDNFRGAEKIYASIDRLFRGPRSRLKAALKVINLHDKDHKLLSVFEKVLRNGSDRKESIWELMQEASSARRRGMLRKCITGGV